MINEQTMVAIVTRNVSESVGGKDEDTFSEPQSPFEESSIAGQAETYASFGLKVKLKKLT